MYELTVDTHFSAAHSLRGYNGECSQLHGHTWKVSVTVKAEKTDDTGISVDFKDISSILDQIIKRFDHRNLSEIDDFSECNPTAEIIAKKVFDFCEDAFSGNEAVVSSVTIAESERYRVTYRKNQGT
ncbi:6-carboxytetrahydropterin synthase QueD [Candidatus Latescibacterota bacterium]